MKHLVLGSEGQIGQYVCEELERQGEEYLRYDIELGPLHDLREVNGTLAECIESCDFIHFLAYDVGGSKYLEQKQNTFKYISNNVRIMENTFNCIGNSGKPFYFASSQMSNMQETVYGQLKKLGESYTEALSGQIVKFWNVYGHETSEDKAHVITDFIKMAVENQEIKCRTNGLEERHFTYGSDAAKTLIEISRALKDTKNEIPSVLEVVNHQQSWITIRDVAKLIAHSVQNKTGLPVEIYFKDKFDTTQSHINSFSSDFRSSSFIDSTMGLEPIGIIEGIDKLIDRYLDERSTLAADDSQ